MMLIDTTKFFPILNEKLDEYRLLTDVDERGRFWDCMRDSLFSEDYVEDDIEDRGDDSGKDEVEID